MGKLVGVSQSTRSMPIYSNTDGICVVPQYRIIIIVFSNIFVVCCVLVISFLLRKNNVHCWSLLSFALLCFQLLCQYTCYIWCFVTLVNNRVHWLSNITNGDSKYKKTLYLNAHYQFMDYILKLLTLIYPSVLNSYTTCNLFTFLYFQWNKCCRGK